MFQMKTSPQLRFKVQGYTADEAGKANEFAFFLIADRLATVADVQQLEADAVAAEKKGSTTPLTDALVSRVKGWADVVDETGSAEVPFDEVALRALLNHTGMATLTHGAYLRACSAQPR